VPIPENYLDYVNRPRPEKELESIRESIMKNRPFGENDWVNKIVNKFGLGTTLKKRGRPKKGT